MTPIFCRLLSVTHLVILTSAAVSPGSRLRASAKTEKWTSPNNTFSLGFISSSSSSSAVAAITTASVTVWSAGTAVDDGGILELTSAGDLTLVNGSGHLVWSSGTGRLGVKTAEMEDSGNFVLRNSSGEAVWSSFENPTDTVVPTQNFSVGMKLRAGVYSFSILPSGNLTLRWNDTVVYWNSGLNSSVDSNVSSPTLELQQIGILILSDPSISGPAKVIYSSDYADNVALRFLRLGSDGNLRIYSLQALGTATATERWAAVDDQCEVYGYCGDLGVCGYNRSNPVCSCPSANFEFSDPGDTRKGCRRKTELSDCPSAMSMLEMGNARFLTYPPELVPESVYAGISACRDRCFASDSCAGSTALSDGTGICLMKVPGFLSAYRSPALQSTLYLKVCGGPVPPQPDPPSGPPPGGTRLGVVAISVAAALLGLLSVEVALWFLFCRSRPWSGDHPLPEYASVAPVQFSHRELLRATKGFRERLGEGGFGAVYRGALQDGTGIAVKRLEGIEQGEKQFRMEVATISCTHHLNLVRLVGFCSEGRHRLLVYEFMKNRSLDGFIFGGAGAGMGWRARFGVAVGVARGVAYLHEECLECIVHCDIKPENILLDEGYVPKVSDFGLAKLVNPRDHRRRALKSVRGTRGYLAPEWLADLPVTTKSDVYSYGMVLLELVSGKRNFEISDATGFKKFSVWAFEQLETGNAAGIVDSIVKEGDDVDMEQVTRAVRVSFWCVQEHPSHRPPMGKVLQMLEGVVPVWDPPDPKPEKPASGLSGIPAPENPHGPI